MGVVRAVCVSEKKGVPKRDVKSARFVSQWGIENDVHGGDGLRQVSLLSNDKIEQFKKLGADVNHGDFGENLVVEGIDCSNLPIGTLLKCNDVILEITQIGKECHARCQIYYKMGDCIMPREGVFARVIKEGIISVGDVMDIIDFMNDAQLATSKFRAVVLTLSDKGARGEREDESGPLAASMLEKSGYTIEERQILPDNRELIEEALINLSDKRQVDLIITTGGTGFARRDITPEATMAVAERIAPGIAEAVRAHSMLITNRAMLSRGVAVIRGGTLIINLPGSPKAVRESLEYILPELAHGIEILRGDANNCARLCQKS